MKSLRATVGATDWSNSLRRMKVGSLRWVFPKTGDELSHKSLSKKLAHHRHTFRTLAVVRDHNLARNNVTATDGMAGTTDSSEQTSVTATNNQVTDKGHGRDGQQPAPTEP